MDKKPRTSPPVGGGTGLELKYWFNACSTAGRGGLF